MNANNQPTIWLCADGTHFGQDGAVFESWDVATASANQLATVYSCDAGELLAALHELDWDDIEDIRAAWLAGEAIPESLQHSTMTQLKMRLYDLRDASDDGN